MEAAVRTPVIVGNQLCIQVQGEEITAEEYHNEAGWMLAVERPTLAAIKQRLSATRQAASCAKVKDPIEEPPAKIQRQQQEKSWQEKVIIR
ncbi:hypothetical protein MRX96_019197 [Rhipicephalus microplus]